MNVIPGQAIAAAADAIANTGQEATWELEREAQAENAIRAALPYLTPQLASADS